MARYSEARIAEINRRAREIVNRRPKRQTNGKRQYVRKVYPEHIAEAVETAEREYWKAEYSRAPQGRKPQFPEVRYVESWRTLFEAFQ
jgi:hypothetical protein